MTTDKELADAYRLACQRLFMYDFDDAVAALKEFADELDPPQPEYPDGTIAWIHDSSGWRFLGVRCDRYWRMGDNNGATPVISDREVTKVEPLRVLADDEIAVPVVTKAVGALRDYADHLCREYFYANCGSAVISAYIEAVEDAEAGDQS